MRLIPKRVTSTYLFPFKEDLVRFDFDVDAKDEIACRFLPIDGGLLTPVEGELDGC